MIYSAMYFDTDSLYSRASPPRFYKHILAEQTLSLYLLAKLI